jgi:hypothetical protein
LPILDQNQLNKICLKKKLNIFFKQGDKFILCNQKWKSYTKQYRKPIRVSCDMRTRIVCFFFFSFPVLFEKSDLSRVCVWRAQSIICFERFFWFFLGRCCCWKSLRWRDNGLKKKFGKTNSLVCYLLIYIQLFVTANSAQSLFECVFFWFVKWKSVWSIVW